MTGDAHDKIAATDVGPGASLAPEGHPLRRLLETIIGAALPRRSWPGTLGRRATELWLWLARALPYEPAGARALVLLDHLSGLLVLVGTEALRG
jgi:hypothetical protein